MELEAKRERSLVHIDVCISQSSPQEEVKPVQNVVHSNINYIVRADV